MAERLPSPPLSPLLGQPVERNNNINNMNDSAVVKSNNGQAESEVRRKVTAETMLSAFFFLVVSSITHSRIHACLLSAANAH